MPSQVWMAARTASASCWRSRAACAVPPEVVATTGDRIRSGPLIAWAGVGLEALAKARLALVPDEEEVNGTSLALVA